MSTHEKIYIYELRGKKYYVGKASNVIHRLDEHRSKGVRAAAWTKEHDIIDIIEVRPMLSENDEDNVTEEYMDKYGIDNVRGGVYCTIHLSAETRTFIQTKIWHKKNLCLRCGRPDHMIKFCKCSENIFGEKLDDSSSDDVGGAKDPEGIKGKFTCGHCGKEYKTLNGFNQHKSKCEIVAPSSDIKDKTPLPSLLSKEGKGKVKPLFSSLLDKCEKGESKAPAPSLPSKGEIKAPFSLAPSILSKDGTSEKGEIKEKKKYICEKCGKEGHVAGNWWCVVGTAKEADIKCMKCGESGHYALGCRK